ncbi:hypothetical protein I5E68_09765 [Novosphingobium sp. YJ-S2-02]|uniref:Uncharacterized protein n=1 Tax=Novosphingobium aureum TaxID=2792964 RepID=A0A931MLM6_9SPHN|nr:hypothetical protein [Novosphingobium aureum]MBH0113231.1 hypothetical protein [Novosphingobium aureum]
MLNTKSRDIHADNIAAGWWNPARPNAVSLMLIVSEISEASAAYASPLPKDDKLTDRYGLEVELADAVIRILDLAGFACVDLEAECAALRRFDGRYRSKLPVHRALLEVVNELSAAMEGDRKANRAHFARHLAAAYMRISELCCDLSFDLWGAIEEKRAFNKIRLDHQLAQRRAAGGKAY